MQRRTFIALGLSAALSAGTALAAGVQDAIVAQLSEQGFSSIKVTRTLLGRVRIVAMNNRFRREIVLNPRTGEILRDYWITLDGSEVSVKISSPEDDEGHEEGEEDEGEEDEEDEEDEKEDEEDERDDEEDERDDEEDNSGSGS